MKSLVFSILVASVTVGSVGQGYSQGTIGTNPPPTLYAPLLLFTSGSGSVSPFTNGQVLQVGSSYNMEAIPDLGYAFSSWQSVSVSVDTVFTYDGTGFVVSSVTTNVSPQLDYSYDPVLTFTMSPVVELQSFEETIDNSVGWQANFVSTPEPSDVVLIGCGFLTVALFRRIRPCCLTPRWSQRRLPLEFMDGLGYTMVIEPAEPLARRRGSALDR